MRQMANKGHLTFKYQMGGVHCREREPEHVMKTAYIEELRTCPEKHRVYHVTESFYLPSRFRLHNFKESEWPSNLVHIDLFVNFTSDGVELYVNGCLEYISRKRIHLWISCWTTNQFLTVLSFIIEFKERSEPIFLLKFGFNQKYQIAQALIY